MGIFHIADLDNNLRKRFFLMPGADMLIIVFNPTVFPFLLVIILLQSFIKELVIDLLNRLIAIFSVQRRSFLINIFRNKGAAVVRKRTDARFKTDCLFYGIISFFQTVWWRLL